MSKVDTMIEKFFEAAIRAGIKMDVAQRKRIELEFRSEFGGSRVYHAGELHYVQKFPKQRRAAELAETQKRLGTAAVTLKRIAQATGIPIRSVKRLRNGR